jgi:type II secretory pathway component PulM
MMPDYSVMQNQWLFVILLGGAALLLSVILTYWAMWRPREEEREVAQKQDIRDLRSFVTWLRGVAPWAILLALIGTTAYALIHTTLAALKTPNW